VFPLRGNDGRHGRDVRSRRRQRIGNGPIEDVREHPHELVRATDLVGRCVRQLVFAEHADEVDAGELARERADEVRAPNPFVDNGSIRAQSLGEPRELVLVGYARDDEVVRDGSCA